MGEKLLVANRGEIAVRIIRAAQDLGIETVAVFAEDDAGALHTLLADEAHSLGRGGPAAYLDSAAVIDVARRTGATLVHPGYGFLSESAAFAEACGAAGIVFVGPDPDALRTLGDKIQARDLAREAGVPTAGGLGIGATLAEAREFLVQLGRPVLVKAAAGGGGRGIRVVAEPEELEAAWESCRAEARSAFGDDAVYVEELLEDARHIEVQIVADRTGAVVHVGDRECSIQRRRQKVIELAPAPALSAELRADLHAAAVALARAAGYSSLGTIEFLVTPEGRFVFLEANPRVQVEHTVTEEVFGIDLIALQLRIALGATLESLGIDQHAIGTPSGAAVQFRINAETYSPDGAPLPSTGRVTSLHFPGGPGIRVESALFAGAVVGSRFDSLIAKLIVYSPDGHAAAVAKGLRALRETQVDGVETNLAVLSTLIGLPGAVDGGIPTTFVDRHPELLAAASGIQSLLPSASIAAETRREPSIAVEVPEDSVIGVASSAGVIVGLPAPVGARVRAGDPVAVIEAMKMENLVLASASGVVAALLVELGAQVAAGDRVVAIAADTREHADEEIETDVVDEGPRGDLRELQERLTATTDAARPDAVQRRHGTGRRTIRENLADLIDKGSETEYGQLALAAQRARRSEEDLIRSSPADGLVAVTASVNGESFAAGAACAVLGYDYMVMAGTQGLTNHGKKDRMFDVIERSRLPVVFFAEGGGGRPGDTDHAVVAALNNHTFTAWAGLSGLVPRIAVVNGRCFAGNAAIAGSSDLIIATTSANIGMGGPAMIEGGGLGTFAPEEIGAAREQFARGVVDVLVEDDVEAVATARRVLSYFQGDAPAWESPDTSVLRRAVPENRLRTYDVRAVIRSIFDVDSVTELRAAFSPGMVTSLARIEGATVGVIANSSSELAGAITSGGADKATRFLQLCDAYGFPVVSLIDTPGIMVGPDAESTALVRHANRLFVTAASMSVPLVSIVLRKAYGLGSQAMAGGGMSDPLFVASWPTGEFGGMGIEGGIRLGYRKELEAIVDDAERERYFSSMVADAYRRGRAVNVATYGEIDAVIDPAETRDVIARVLRTQPRRPSWREVPRKRIVDTW